MTERACLPRIALPARQSVRTSSLTRLAPPPFLAQAEETLLVHAATSEEDGLAAQARGVGEALDDVVRRG